MERNDGIFMLQKIIFADKSDVYLLFFISIGYICEKFMHLLHPV